MNKKILMTGWGFPPRIEGGLDIHVARLFEELRDQVEIDLVLPESKAPELPGVIGVETGDGDMIDRANRMSQKVAKLAEDYDIVHTHDWFGAESGLKAKKYADVKWVSTFHSLSSSRSRNSYGRIEEMERGIVDRSDILIAVSRKLAGEISEKYSRKPKVIHNGFSQPKSQGKDVKEELGIENKMIFFVGRHAEQKGIEHLLYAFQKLEEDATLVLGGDGHMKASLEEFTELLDIDKDVIFTGFIPEDELGDYYRAADVFVSPSINEPFGLTLTEALESGTPVVATDNGVEEVVSRDSMVKVRPESDSIKRGIEEALERKDKPEFSSRGWEEVAEETLGLYSSVDDF